MHVNGVYEWEVLASKSTLHNNVDVSRKGNIWSHQQNFHFHSYAFIHYRINGQNEPNVCERKENLLNYNIRWWHNRNVIENRKSYIYPVSCCNINYLCVQKLMRRKILLCMMYFCLYIFIHSHAFIIIRLYALRQMFKHEGAEKG